MKTEAVIRSALVNWQTVANIVVPDDADEETRQDMTDMKRRAKHQAEALEWVLS